MKRCMTTLFVAVAMLCLASLLAAVDLGQGPLVGVAAAAADQSAVGGDDQGVPVSEFMTPDGRIDLETVKANGYQGPLDLKGFDVQIDPVTGEPMLQSSGGKSTRSVPDDVYWENSMSPNGINNDVRALAIYDGKLIAGGFFDTAGTIGVGHIASWDGVDWASLGSGISDGVIYALTVYDGKLIAGGDFYVAGGDSAKHIASWDGSSWSVLGTGMNARVHALTVYDGNLIAGGYFTTAGGVTANYLASWDGSSWSALGTGMNSFVYALTVYNAKLIAGGFFTTAGGVSANEIASWNGSSWSALGTGMGGSNTLVFSLTVYNGNELPPNRLTPRKRGIIFPQEVSDDGQETAIYG